MAETDDDVNRQAAASFLTVKQIVVHEIEIKHSRFIAAVKRVRDEEAARAFIAARRSLDPRARHHCSAFVLRSEHLTQRSNDDGEPSGTAGAPMLEVLLGHGLGDVVAVVTRYFGGTLLGAGGLVRAYGDAVGGAVASSRLVRCEPLERISVAADYPTAARIESDARSHGWVVLPGDYGAEVSLCFAVAPSDLDSALARIAESSAGRARVVRRGVSYFDR